MIDNIKIDKKRGTIAKVVSNGRVTIPRNILRYLEVTDGDHIVVTFATSPDMPRLLELIGKDV